ncbi:MAG TPA: arylesterase [Bryobacteraceae bacterium]|jgi:acyl-CoA thioesterase I|nr:arylesterase [Bryobacteraceae bacterium]
MLYSIFIALFLSINAWAAPPAQAAVQTLPKEDTRKVLVVFGDSLSAGYGVPRGQSYPDDLQRKLDAQGYGWRVVNLGISGDTTSGGLARVNTATALRPAMVLLELGGNDGLRGLPLTMTRENLDRIITAFERAGARVVLAGMTLPPNYGPDYIQGFEAIYRGLAAKYKLPLIPFLLRDIATQDMRYFQRDGIHPTAEGAQIVSNTVFRAIKPLLGTVKN